MSRRKRMHVSNVSNMEDGNQRHTSNDNANEDDEEEDQ